jgi:hypothetical protein
MGSIAAAQPFLRPETSPFRIFSLSPQLPLAEIKNFVCV